MPLRRSRPQTHLHIRKRRAYRAASKLVRQFPDREEHWVLFRWATLTLEKRKVDIRYSEPNTAFWSDLANNVKDLDSVLRKGWSSQTSSVDNNHFDLDFKIRVESLDDNP